MPTIQSVSNNNYSYENIDVLEKSQETQIEQSGQAAQAQEAQTTQMEVQEESLQTQASNNQAKIKPTNPEEALEKHLTETSEYSQKIRDKITSVQGPEQDKYVEMALELKRTIENLIGVITEEDVKNVIQENYNPEKLSIDMLCKVINENKVAFKINDFEKLKAEVEEQVKIFEAQFSDIETLKQTIKSLKENNLPVDRRNIEKIQQIVNKADDIKKISNQTIVNLLKQNKELTIENIYKAKYMGDRSGETGEADDLKELDAQIKALLKSEGLKASKENVTLSKMLIKNKVPLDHQTFEKIKVLKEGIKELKVENIIDRAVENLAHNKPLGNVPINEEANVDTKEVIDEAAHEKLIKQVHKIENKHIHQVHRNNQEINLKHLIMAMEEKATVEIETKDTQTKDTQTKDMNIPIDELKMIKAALNLEEIRLKMTVESASRMAEKGIKVELEPLEELVKALRQLERESHAKHLAHNSVEPSPGNISKVEAVYEKLDLMKGISPQIMAKVMTKELDFTIKEIANEVRDEMVQEKAQKSYQLLGTKPRRDLGDTIEKTFSQIEGLLEELKIEPTKSNIKAAKILAKNEMPITKENIDAVRLIDMKVVKVTEKLHPSIVVNMIKEQRSPIDMHVDEVLQYMTDFEMRLGITSDEKIANAIQELDNSKELTKEERESLIGIYRMFTTVSKSKGAAVGFLIKNNFPLNLTNLFEAAKYIKNTKGDHKLIEVDIDDGFGILTDIKYEGKNIKEQIETAIQKDNLAPTKNLMNLIQGLEEAGINIDGESLQKAAVNEKLLETFLDKTSYDKIISLFKEGFLKDGKMSIDQLMDQIDERGNSTWESIEYDDVLKQVKSLAQIDIETLKNFEKYGLNKTLPNLITANEIEKNPFMLMDKIKDLIKTLDGLPIDTKQLRETLLHKNETNPIREYEETLEKVKEQLSKLQEELLETQGVDKGTINKSINQTIKLVDYQKALHNRDEYYQIPIMIGGKITQMNMYYSRENTAQKSEEEQSSMNIYMFFHTDNIGKVQANIRLDRDKMDFSMYANDPEDMELVKSFGNKIKTLLTSTEFTVENINFGFFEAKSPIGEALKDSKKDPMKMHTDSKFEKTV
ncbi:MAG: hypothetical protein CVV02_15095 [Firmicutes bacterium HGW-Firmicutes-7]|nr:MAG: hypothetical protein CVV02_15095 [Firmicutes bacterium HGW-Firmicutes-7]